MQLPNIQNQDREFQLMQSKWASILNPVLAKPQTNSLLLKDITLINGVNTINHLLGRTMQGWIIADLNEGATIWRVEPFNDLTITLSSDSDCTISLLVF